MFNGNTTKAGSVERAGVPRAPVLGALSGAFLTGYLLTINIAMAMGFLSFLVLFGITVLQPVMLIGPLVVLPVFMEATLQSWSITVGGRELLNFYGVVNLGLVAAGLFYTITGRVRPFESRVTGAFALYLAAILLSLPFSADFLMTVRTAVRVSAGYCVYLMITQFVTEKRQIDRVFQVFLLGSAVPIVAGLYQIAVWNQFALLRTMRIRGTVPNGMSYAMYLGVILPYLFGQIVFARSGRARKGLFAVLFLAGLVNLVYASTRIGWGAFVFTMILYAVFTDAKRFLPIVLVSLLVFVVVFFPFFVEHFGGYFTTDWKTYMSDDIRWDFRSADYITASSLHIRVYVWRNMVRKLAETNLLFGLGSGTWFENLDVQMIGFPIASHSDYFEVLFGAGLVGLVLYLLFRFKQLILLARFARGPAEREIRTTVLFPSLAVHIACLGMSLTEVWQAYACIYWISWIAIAISECYWRWYCEHESLHIAAASVPLSVAHK